MLKGVIFDFDGTLTELTLDFVFLRTEVEKIARSYVTDDIIRSFKGLYILEMIDAIEATVDGDGSLFRQEAFARLRDLEVEAAKGKAVYPYVRGTLQQLRDQGMAIGIITRSCVGAIREVFPDIDNFAGCIKTREDTRFVKPHPAHVLAVLECFGLAPGEALLVGDHPTDIIAGRALNMPTMGVLTGRTTREGFEEVQATYICDDIRGVLSIGAE